MARPPDQNRHPPTMANAHSPRPRLRPMRRRTLPLPRPPHHSMDRPRQRPHRHRQPRAGLQPTPPPHPPTPPHPHPRTQRPMGHPHPQQPSIGQPHPAARCPPRPQTPRPKRPRPGRFRRPGPGQPQQPCPEHKAASRNPSRTMTRPAGGRGYCAWATRRDNWRLSEPGRGQHVQASDLAADTTAIGNYQSRTVTGTSSTIRAHPPAAHRRKPRAVGQCARPGGGTGVSVGAARGDDRPRDRTRRPGRPVTSL